MIISKALHNQRIRLWLPGLLAIMLFALPGLPRPGWADPPKLGEYEVKAGFLYNFINFIKWPEETPDNTDAFVLAVSGARSPVKTIANALAGETIHGRPIKVIAVDELFRASEAQMIFILASSPLEPEKILLHLKGKPIITVGEVADFAQQGGMINFITQANKIRFEINQKTAQAAGLKISSQLLKLAILVIEPHSRQNSGFNPSGWLAAITETAGAVVPLR